MDSMQRSGEQTHDVLSECNENLSRLNSQMPTTRRVVDGGRVSMSSTPTPMIAKPVLETPVSGVTTCVDQSPKTKRRGRGPSTHIVNQNMDTHGIPVPYSSNCPGRRGRKSNVISSIVQESIIKSDKKMDTFGVNDKSDTNNVHQKHYTTEQCEAGSSSGARNLYHNFNKAGDHFQYEEIYFDIGLTPHLGRRLWQRYIVDAFTAVEQYMLDWISRNQTTIRSDLYSSIRDALRRGDNDPDHVGKCIILSASFTGSPRYVSQYFKDSLALCRVIGHPTLFLTMTCNSKSSEIKEMMKHLPEVDICDAPDIVTRLHPDDRPKNTDQIDALVSAEIPDKNKDPVGYAVVKNYMIHGPCRQDYTNSPCMVKGKCMRHFPKMYNSNTCFDDCGFLVYRRRRTATRVNVKGTDLDNQYVMPFNRDLLVMFQCHINLKICNNPRSLKYLFKYCLKGHDHTKMMLKKNKATTSAGTRTLDQKYVSLKTGESLHKVCDHATTKRTKLEAWFVANKEIPRAREFTYSEFPSQFTWLSRECKWKERQRGDVVGRLSEVHATAGDLLYLRMLLMRRKGCLTFEDIRSVNGHVYDSFKETCAALGLLQDDRQWHEAMVENSESSFPNQLREMFVNILAYCSVTVPLSLWNDHWRCMSDDIEHNRRRVMQDNNIRLSESDKRNYALAEIEKLLNDVDRSLKDYTTMSFPPDLFRCTYQLTHY
ncbi:uncharacterized protein LOC141698198 [Apium graveolens]|uniref:uncharacterized protein LOC141698198 n=1 Tax=Apium graveolens TaxID=4045 RepID=UPI003D7B375B